MQLGIFGKTFDTLGAAETFDAVSRAGYKAAQFNFASLGLPSMPDDLDTAVAIEVRDAAKAAGITIAGVSGTYNMIHPDISVRKLGLARLEIICAATAAMGADLVTLCTGTRDANDQWHGHPDNASADAWHDLLQEMASAIRIADSHRIRLGIEPELANVVSSARAARRLLDELASPVLCVVLDAANLFETANAAERRRLVDEAVDLLGKDIAMAHAKDRRANGGFCAAGKGVIDFDHFVAGLKSAGFSGPLVTHGLEAAEAPAVADFLKGVLARTAAA